MSGRKTCIYVGLMLVLYGLPCIGVAQIKRSVSTNFPSLLEKLPYQTNKPLAREIRYTYASALDLLGKKKPKDPFVVSNEKEGYERQTTTGTDWNRYLNQQAKSMDQSNRDFLDKYESGMSPETMESHLAMNRSIQTSIGTLQAYLSIMGGLSALAVNWANKEAMALASWTETTTKCIGDEAPEGSVLHLEVMWLVKGRSFKFHSENDIWVIATLETGDERWISTKQIMQMWVDTKKTKVSPEGALPFNYLEDISEEHRELLAPLAKKHGILPFHGMLVNAAVEDLRLHLDSNAE